MSANAKILKGVYSDSLKQHTASVNKWKGLLKCEIGKVGVLESSDKPNDFQEKYWGKVKAVYMEDEKCKYSGYAEYYLFVVRYLDDNRFISENLLGIIYVYTNSG